MIVIRTRGFFMGISTRKKAANQIDAREFYRFTPLMQASAL